MEQTPLQDFLNSVNELFGTKLAVLLTAQDSQILELRVEVSRLQEQVTLLAVDLEAALRAQEDADRRTLTEAEYGYYDLAGEYENIVDQLSVVIDKRCAQEASDDQDRRAREAELISKSTVVLFGAPEIDRASLAAVFGDPAVDADLERLCDRVAELRAKGDAGSQSWDFTFEKGKPLDPARQVGWPGCPADGSACFVVAPAYVAHDRVLAKQRVFTKQELKEEAKTEPEHELKEEAKTEPEHELKEEAKTEPEAGARQAPAQKPGKHGKSRKWWPPRPFGT
jgi:hypothetical protein